MRRAGAEQSQEADRGSERIETCFEKLVGRQATEAERTRLSRLRDVLGLKDNDAFWAIVMALEHYDALFREYPERLAQLTERMLEDTRSLQRSSSKSPTCSVRYRKRWRPPVRRSPGSWSTSLSQFTG
jgi:hypothetical protein